jgi:DNA-binding response OmpR family regulator
MNGSGSVLLVEEDVLVRHGLAEYLRECGFKVWEAVNPDEARQLLLKGSGGVEIAMVDAASTSDRGYTLANWIRSQYPEIQVIKSGSLANAAEEAASLCEQGPMLTKPYDHRLVVSHIRRLQAARQRSKGE